jgi:hypothetical protein
LQNLFPFYLILIYFYAFETMWVLSLEFWVLSFEFCYSFLFLRFFLRTWHLAWKLISVPGNQKCFCIDNKNTTILSHSTIFVFKMTFLGFDYRDRYINISCKIIFPKWFLNKKMKIVSFFSVFGNSCDFFISLFFVKFSKSLFYLLQSKWIQHHSISFDDKIKKKKTVVKSFIESKVIFS